MNINRQRIEVAELLSPSSRGYHQRTDVLAPAPESLPDRGWIDSQYEQVALGVGASGATEHPTRPRL